MSNKSDKPLALIMIAGCIAAILIFHFAWSRQFFHNLDNWLFTIVDGLLIGGFIFESIGAYNQADDPNKDWKRKVVIGIAAALCIWAGAWAAYVNEQAL